MTEIQVNASSRYSVVTGDLKNIALSVKKVIKPCRVAVISDENVEKHYLSVVKNSLEREGYEVFSFVILAGEQYKNFAVYQSILKFLIEKKLTRQDVVLSLGGGVVSDMAGFAAATYLRGVKHVIVPTTLLSIIDASIGGKTAIDVEEGKNLVGAFYQPSLVYVDINVLKTLPEKEILSGLGEGIKYALLEGGRLYDIVKGGVNEDNLLEFVTLCIKCKVKIVEADEKEGNLRKLLNLGHTFGHAIEKVSNYEIPHGVAVVKGIEYIVRNYCDIAEEQKEEIFALAKRYGYDKYDYSGDLYVFLENDKKRVLNEKIDLVTLDGIGMPTIKTYNLEDLR